MMDVAIHGGNPFGQYGVEGFLFCLGGDLASGVKEVSRLLEIDKDTRQIDLRDGQGRISRRFLRQVKNNPCYL